MPQQLFDPEGDFVPFSYGKDDRIQFWSAIQHNLIELMMRIN